MTARQLLPIGFHWKDSDGDSVLELDEKSTSDEILGAGQLWFRVDDQGWPFLPRSRLGKAVSIHMMGRTHNDKTSYGSYLGALKS